MYIPNSGYAVPFCRPLDGPMHPGRLMAVYGVVPHGAETFTVNLQVGGAPYPRADIALHLSVRFRERVVVRNSLRGGAWMQEERHGHFPLQHGRPFQLLILCEQNEFKIAFNGSHFSHYHHRLPYNYITHFSVEGSVDINNVTGVVGFSGGDRIYTPRIPHVQPIEPFFPGRLIRIQGRVPMNAYRFGVNLVSGPSVDYDDILFHASVRPSEGIVELNTKSGGWQQAFPIRQCPFRPGQPFEILILVDMYNYKVALNGVHFADFPHRMPYQRVRYLVVDGTVELSVVSIEGQRRDGGFNFGPSMPPPGELPHFACPYDGYDNKYCHFPNPYPIIY